MTATVETASPRAIAARALGSADQFLVAARRLVPGIADGLRGGPDPAALGDLARLFDGVLSLARLSADIGTVVPLGNSPVDIEEIRRLTADLVAIEERADWNALADLLVERVIPRLEEWQASFEELASRL